MPSKNFLIHWHYWYNIEFSSFSVILIPFQFFDWHIALGDQQIAAEDAAQLIINKVEEAQVILDLQNLYS